MTPPEQRDKTAGELIAELASDPAYRARRAALDREHRQRVAASGRVLAPLHRDLAEVGYPVGHVDELRTSGKRFEAAVPVLLAWLPRLENPTDREVIVRVLSFRWTGDPVMRAFLSMFPSVPNADFYLKWAIGNGIEVLARERYFPEMAALARDVAHGRTREMIVLGLGSIRTPESERLLIELLEDDDVSGHAVVALGKVGSWTARAPLMRFLDHPRDWVRRAAAKALARIAKAAPP